MPEIKSMDRIKDAWKRRSAASTPDYTAGIQNPRKDWASETVAAEENYNAGVQAAVARGAFGKGVADAGTDKWKRNALSKGVQRWASGIALAENAYVAGFTPYAQVIANTTLPPRGPKGDPKNIERVRVMADALHQEKVRRTTG
ncbi:MAG: hypothetical protein KAV00_12175 [Phycisphaerae bacterium]|nr:hypothetical protein [Phycisphaerae bacterium]